MAGEWEKEEVELRPEKAEFIIHSSLHSLQGRGILARHLCTV